MEFTSFGAITEDGGKGFFSGVRDYDIERVTRTEIEEIENDFDQIEAPPGPYTIQPHKQGRYPDNKMFRDKQKRKFYRKTCLAFWISRNGQIHISPVSSKGSRLRLLRGRCFWPSFEPLQYPRVRQPFPGDQLPESAQR